MSYVKRSHSSSAARCRSKGLAQRHETHAVANDVRRDHLRRQQSRIACVAASDHPDGHACAAGASSRVPRRGAGHTTLSTCVGREQVATANSLRCPLPCQSVALYTDPNHAERAAKGRWLSGSNASRSYGQGKARLKVRHNTPARERAAFAGAARCEGHKGLRSAIDRENKKREWQGKPAMQCLLDCAGSRGGGDVDAHLAWTAAVLWPLPPPRTKPVAEPIQTLSESSCLFHAILC